MYIFYKKPITKHQFLLYNFSRFPDNQLAVASSILFQSCGDLRDVRYVPKRRSDRVSAAATGDTVARTVQDGAGAVGFVNFVKVSLKLQIFMS